MKTGIELIAAERLRQVEVEGYDVIKDDAYVDYELSSAAAAYLLPSHDYEETYVDETDDIESIIEKEANPTQVNSLWPWQLQYFKPSRISDTGIRPSVKDLVKAGALIAAEIDRLQNQK
jgi:hypothetical protein